MSDFMRAEHQGVAYWHAPLLTQAGLCHGVSERIGGKSTGHLSSLNFGFSAGDSYEYLVQNYHIFLEAIGAGKMDCFISRQVHETLVKKCGEEDLLILQPQASRTVADGLWTDGKAKVLIKQFADCVPVFIYDPLAHCFAVVHAGWRGTAAGIAKIALQELCQNAGAKAERMLCAIGPSIGPCCFQTGDDCAAAFSPSCVITTEGKQSVNLWKANKNMLIDAGVLPQNIAIAQICTACNTRAFYSHRAEQGQTGRMVGFAFLP